MFVVRLDYLLYFAGVVGRFNKLLLFGYILIFWSRFIIDVVIYFYLWCFNYQWTNSNSFTSRNGMATFCLQICLHISLTYLHYFCTNVLHFFSQVTFFSAATSLPVHFCSSKQASQGKTITVPLIWGTKDVLKHYEQDIILNLWSVWIWCQSIT
jgi:hypothetical protein